jgi:hypothetical protein
MTGAVNGLFHETAKIFTGTTKLAAKHGNGRIMRPQGTHLL